MADEAILVYETHVPIPFTISNTTGIELGTSLAATDPFTAIATTVLGQPCAGFAKTEKIASDGKTKLAVYRGGIFKVVASGSITVGDPVTNAGVPNTNRFEKAATNEEDVWGIALETCTDGESFLMELRPTSMSLA